MIKFLINPVGKPRMTRADAWKKRDAVKRYWAFKDELKKQSAHNAYKLTNPCLKIDFVMPQPPSWSRKKKELMKGAIHQQKPDIDNLVKAFLDCQLEDDSFVSELHAKKVWGDYGAIIVYNLPEENLS